MMVVKFDSETMAFLHSMSKKGVFDVLIKSSSLRQSFQTICHIHIRKKSSQKNWYQKLCLKGGFPSDLTRILTASHSNPLILIPLWYKMKELSYLLFFFAFSKGVFSVLWRKDENVWRVQSIKKYNLKSKLKFDKLSDWQFDNFSMEFLYQSVHGFVIT